MKKWFRRLSSKDLKPLSPHDLANYNAGNPSSQGRGAHNAVNPTFQADPPNGAAPQQRNLNNNVQLDHQQSENTAFERPAAKPAQRDLSPSTRSVSSGLNGIKGRAPSSGLNNGHQRSRRSRTQSLSGSIYDSSDAESIASAQFEAASERGWQPTKPIQPRHTSPYNDDQSQLLAVTLRKPGPASASNHSTHGHRQHSTQEADSIPQSIYRSYDTDILNSGGKDIDRNPILFTAPSADWTWGEASYQPSSMHGYDSMRRQRSGGFPSPQHAAKPPLAKTAHSLPIPRKSGRLTEVMHYASPASSPRNGSFHKSNVTGDFNFQPAMQPDKTPHGQHPYRLGSDDLDTAMRSAAQSRSQQGAIQANGNTGRALLSSNLKLSTCMQHHHYHTMATIKSILWSAHIHKPSFCHGSATWAFKRLHASLQ